MPDSAPVDVLILTAADDEPEGVLAVSEGRVGDWREEPQVWGWPARLWRAEFLTSDGRRLQVVLSEPLTQRPQGTANACGILGAHYRPRCLAMSGEFAPAAPARPTWAMSCCLSVRSATTREPR